MRPAVLTDRLDKLAEEAAGLYPFYRSLAGTHAASLRFDELPYVDKAAINADRAAFELAEEPNVTASRLVSFTSGSTGTPFRCIRTKSEQLALSMAIQRSRLRHGLPTGFRLLLLGNSLFAEPRMAAFYANQALKGDGPHLIQGRCSGLYELALHFERHLLPVPKALRFTQNWGEYPQPAQRRLIERVFGVPMLDYYGMEELWLIAFTNGQGELEIDEDLVYAETLDPRTGEALPEGESGELAVTSFVMRSLPFLRYRTGDMGRIVRQRGERGPVLELMPFRQSQIRLPGRVINASVLRYLDRFYQSLAVELDVRQFQLRQEKEDAFRLSVAAADGVSAEQLADAARRLERLLAQCLLLERLDVAIEHVDRIEPHPVSGKNQPFVSLVPAGN